MKRISMVLLIMIGVYLKSKVIAAIYHAGFSYFCSMEYNDIIGIIGVGLTLIAYFCLTFKWLKEGRLFFILNVLGAGLTCYASWLIKYWPFMVLEGIWCIVSAVGLWRQWSKP